MATYASGKRRGQRCNNGGYYKYENEIRCGVHSKAKNRTKLIKNPNAEKKKRESETQRNVLIEKTARLNAQDGKRGQIILTRLAMMRQIKHVDGFLKVFPNFKHQNRGDGFGCSELSPKSLGPIDHNQPGLPIAKNLENFHQGSKCFAPELTPEGNPGSDFYKTQISMFEDVIPHRHKPVVISGKFKGNGNKNICLFWVWRRSDGTEVRFSYLECRQFYCNYYERLASKKDDFKLLLSKLEKGYNLQIVGYDAYPVIVPEGDTLAQVLEKRYTDMSRPFGHELVLYTMLSVPTSDYPWRKHKTEEF